MNYQCDHMLCQMVKDLNEDPMYWLGASFFSGFLFSTWSWGILYLIVFLIIWEIGYYIYCYAYKGWDGYGHMFGDYRVNYFMIRLGIVAGAIMGFLIGRAIIEDDDHEQSIKDFWATISKYY